MRGGLEEGTNGRVDDGVPSSEPVGGLGRVGSVRDIVEEQGVGPCESSRGCY
jgi:hypothetical protein